MRGLLKNGYKAKLRPSGHDISNKFSLDNGAAIPPNLIAIPNTESNSYYLRYCEKHGIKVHPARFPSTLPEFFIRMLTNEGDNVLDPFAGSCVTGEVCEKLRRRWACVERREEYVKGAMGRFERAPQPEQESMFDIGSVGVTISLTTLPLSGTDTSPRWLKTEGRRGGCVPAVAPKEIVSAIINALEESGCAATLTSLLQKQPRHFILVGQNVPDSLTVYAWSLTPGGRPSLPNEYRIQMTSVKSPLQISTNGPTVLMGYDAERNLFAGFDLSRHRTFTTGSPSIQIGIAELREAEKNGLSFYRKSNEEIAIGIRPDMFVAYAMNAALLHRYGRDANIRKLLDQAGRGATGPSEGGRRPPSGPPESRGGDQPPEQGCSV